MTLVAGTEPERRDVPFDVPDLIRSRIRDVPDYPSPGILFKDITPLLADHIAFAHAVDAIVDPPRPRHDRQGRRRRGARVHHRGARGLPLRRGVRAGAQEGQAAQRHLRAVLRARVRPARPSRCTRTHSHPGDRVVIVDDVLATGGTAAAAAALIERAGGVLVGVSVVIELEFLGGRQRLDRRRPRRAQPRPLLTAPGRVACSPIVEIPGFQRGAVVANDVAPTATDDAPARAIADDAAPARRPGGRAPSGRRPRQVVRDSRWPRSCGTRPAQPHQAGQQPAGGDRRAAEDPARHAPQGRHRARCSGPTSSPRRSTAARRAAPASPYITHPIAVATIAAELGMDVTTCVAALLHDTVEDTADVAGGDHAPSSARRSAASSTA